MKLYDMGAAPNPRRVRIFLAEKGIEVERIDIDIVSGANREPAYLTINPRGVLPALLLDDGTLIDESEAICRYFEALHPEPNLFGRGAEEIGLVQMWSRRSEFEGMAAVANIFRNTATQFAGRAGAGAGGPSPQIPELAERGRGQIKRFFSLIETRLAESEWLGGGRFTVADITAMVAIDFAKWVKIATPEENFATQRWYEAARSRASATA